MRRTIVEPADVSASALADLKNWLGISRSNEDELLKDLLLSSVALCEAFTGQAPLYQLVEERLPVRAGRYVLGFRPVLSFGGAESVAQSGIRTALALDDFEFTLQPDSTACFELLRDMEGQAIAVRARSGLAGTWDDVPAPLKQGIIRLAGYYYRDRDVPGSAKSANAPPTVVTALWQPWRIMRLA